MWVPTRKMFCITKLRSNITVGLIFANKLSSRHNMDKNRQKISVEILYKTGKV